MENQAWATIPIFMSKKGKTSHDTVEQPLSENMTKLRPWKHPNVPDHCSINSSISLPMRSAKRQKGLYTAEKYKCSNFQASLLTFSTGKQV
jgi:hypothetical protein